MSGLVIVLKGLSVVFLSMEGPGQMVTAVGPHGLVFCVMKGMQSQMLDFGKIFFVKEMVSQLIQNHWVGPLNTVKVNFLKVKFLGTHFDNI